MVSELVASIEGVGGSADDGEVVRSLLVARDRLEARLCEALVGFFTAGRHHVEGWRSPVGWLKANGALTDRDARRLSVRVDRLTRWPVLARGWFDGALDGAQVEVVVALIPVGLVDLFAAHDTEVSPLLVGLTAAQTRVAVREWVVRADAVTSPDPAEVDQPVEVDARVRLSRTSGGRGVLDGDLDALTAELFEIALRVMQRPDIPGEFRTAAQRRGEALRDLARFVLDNHTGDAGDPGGSRRPGRQHPHVLAVMDLDDLYAAMLAGLGVRNADDLIRQRARALTPAA